MITRVSASAGSGKTFSLTQRFLALLQEAAPLASLPGCTLEYDNSVYSLAEILAATFTNKAAAEMKSRVLTALKQQALDEREGRREQEKTGPESAEQWVERILRNYNRLNIRTIDSLLAALVRLSAIPLRLSPDFEHSFDPEEYFTPLYDALMDDLRVVPFQQDSPDENGESRPKFLHADAASLRAALSDACNTLLYNDRFTGFSPKKRLRAHVMELVERLLREEYVPVADSQAIHTCIRKLHTDLQGKAASFLDVLQREELKPHANLTKFLERCPGLTPYGKLPQCSYLYYPELDAILNKTSKGKASPVAEKAYLDMQQAAAVFDAALPLLLSALQLAPLSMLAHELYKRMHSPEAENNLMPAIRLPVLARQALSGEHGVSDALCRMGSRLSRLLLDEFQDTSREQWSAILPLVEESLSGGGSFTYVGDVKQAIYSWRGGDARLFAEAAHEPTLQAMVPAPNLENLPCNWRSHPAIVTHNNAFFSLLSDSGMAERVMASMLPSGTPQRWVAQAAQEAALMFAECKQEVPPQKDWENHPRSEHSCVALYLAEAESVAGIERLVHDRMRSLFLDELVHQWRYGDIAVLVRSGEEGALAARWLTEWGLPVVTENSFLISAHPLIARLISFLSFLDYPPDDMAFWEFVSGPECFTAAAGISDEMLSKWLAKVREPEAASRTPLYVHFQRSFPELWQNFIAPFHNQAGLLSAYDLLMEVVKRFDLFSRAPDCEAFLRRLLELAHLAEGRGHSSLSAFLAFWHQHKENEHLPLPESMNAVRIMTIHKAKGLEFPVVVLPFQHRGQAGEAGMTALSLHGIECLCKVTDALPDTYYPALITHELERLSLLYVAWTRPVHALHAFVTRPKRATPLSKGLSVLLDAYRQNVPEHLYRWEDLQSAVDAHDAEGDSLEVTLEDEDMLYWENPDAFASSAQTEKDGDAQESIKREPVMGWLPRLKIYRSSLEDVEFSAKRRGTLVHLCLEQLILREPRTDASLREDVSRAVAQALRLFPLPIPLGGRDAILRDMETCLLWFASLPQAPLWMRYGQREQGILDAAGNMHRVDLLVDAGTDGLWAIDYKTGHVRGTVQHESYRNQVRRYMTLLSLAQPRPVSGLLVFLDEQRIEEVDLPDDSVLQEAAQL